MTETRREWLCVGAMALLAFALRLIWALHTHAPTLDTAIVALMAMDIQDGARPLFFAGQGYMGALEAYLTALVFAFTGPGRVSMCVIPSLAGAAWGMLSYILLRRFFPVIPSAAGALTLLFPAEHVLWYTALPYGGYPEMLALGTAAVLHAVSRLQAPARLHPWADASLLALLGGLTAWTNLQGLPFLATAGILWLHILWPHRLRPSRWLPFALFPLALLLAILPQILLSRQNPASPPLFQDQEFYRLLRNFRDLLRDDLPQLFDWPEAGLLAHAAAIPLLILVLAGLPPLRKHKSLAVVMALHTAFFLLLYLPHPLAGIAPRYLIVWAAPLCAVLTAAAMQPPFLRRFGIPLFLLWFGLQSAGYIQSIRAHHPGMLQRMENRADIVRQARELGFDAVRIVGSVMEGHDGSFFSLESRNQPVFSSSYDERRYTAQIAWTHAKNPGYLFPHGFEPFIRGSLAELDLPVPEIHRAGGMRLMRVPRPPPGGEHILSPTSSELTLSPDRLAFRFAEPRTVSGLRLLADREAELPYRYEVDGIMADGSRVTLRQSERRLASTRIIGDRVIFKGYEPWMDIRFPAQELLGIELRAQTGRVNPTPPRLLDAFVIEPADVPQPSYQDLVPIPYNPRIPGTRPLPPLGDS